MSPHNPVPGEHFSSPAPGDSHAETPTETLGVPEDKGEASHHGSEHDHHDGHGNPFSTLTNWKSLSDVYPNYNVSGDIIPGTNEAEYVERQEYWFPELRFPTPKDPPKPKDPNDHHHDDHSHSDWDPFVIRSPVWVAAGARPGEYVWDRVDDGLMFAFIALCIAFYWVLNYNTTWNWKQWAIIELQRRSADRYDNNSAGKSDKYIQLEVPASRFPKIPLEQDIWNWCPIPKFSDAKMSVVVKGAEMRHPNRFTPAKEVQEYRERQKKLYEKKQAQKQGASEKSSN